MKLKIILLTILIVTVYSSYTYGRTFWYPVMANVIGKQTVTEVIERYEEKTRNHFTPLFQKQGIAYPPKHLALIAYKDVAILEVWGANEDKDFMKITEYPILAASGLLGPKLREGDRQVPEGLYKIIGFNPNSAFHVSMKLNYPSAFDLKQAKEDGRKSPGTNIFIHGRACLLYTSPSPRDS